MRRSVLLYCPLLLSIPLVFFLYISVEVWLENDDRNLASGSRAKRHGLPEKPLPEDSAGNVKVMAKEEPNPGTLLEKPGPVRNVTFPPFTVIKKHGEFGKPVVINESLLTADEKARYDLGWKHNSFNQYVSDIISIHRSLPHGWSQECTKKKFRSDLPEVSVILIFHNEAWSILLRSAHSVLSRTPAKLLREVILVDDSSTMGHLKEPLDEYWRTTDKRVKVIHSKERVGLTRARLIGFQASTAPMVVFFDSHIECFPGWLEPLADRIASDPNVTVFPSIEVINYTTFSINLNHNVGVVGTFRWKDLNFIWDSVPQEELKRRNYSSADPIRSPTMPGGLFAISRELFMRLGTYDPGLDYWGGENIELSFKAWMCYGSVELVPCSHVGHIFRTANPIKWKVNLGNKNVVRVAKVWMDDYINYFLERNNFKEIESGDVTDRLKLREKLQCRDFAWYIKNVHPVPVVPQVQNAGEIRLAETNLCIDSYGDMSNVPKLYDCHGQGVNQFWYISTEGEMFQEERKICEINSKIQLSASCQDKWNVTAHQQLLHIASGRCLQSGEEIGQGQRNFTLTLQQCNHQSKLQKWHTTPRRKDIHFPPFQ